MIFEIGMVHVHVPKYIKQYILHMDVSYIVHCGYNMYIDIFYGVTY